jgi:hypothetical protein
MNPKTVTLFLLLACSAAFQAAGAQQTTPSAAGTSAAAEDTGPTEAQEIVDDTQLSMEMAREGQFGRISQRDMNRLESAYAHIIATLSDVDTLAQLNPQLRQSLVLAQSQFDEILKPEDDDRKICKRVASTGTRLGVLECLTLAERRNRAENSREIVKETQRGFCIPGEGNACGTPL